MLNWCLHGEQEVTYHINYLQQGKLEFDDERLGVIQYRSFQTIVVPQQFSVQASLAFPLLRDYRTREVSVIHSVTQSPFFVCFVENSFLLCL